MSKLAAKTMLVDKQKFIVLLDQGHTDQVLLQLIDITQFLNVPALHDRANEQMARFQQAADPDKQTLSEIHAAARRIIDELPADFGGGAAAGAAEGEKKGFWKRLFG